MFLPIDVYCVVLLWIFIVLLLSCHVTPYGFRTKHWYRTDLSHVFRHKTGCTMTKVTKCAVLWYYRYRIRLSFPGFIENVTVFLSFLKTQSRIVNSFHGPMNPSPVQSSFHPSTLFTNAVHVVWAKSNNWCNFKTKYMRRQLYVYISVIYKNIIMRNWYKFLYVKARVADTHLSFIGHNGSYKHSDLRACYLYVLLPRVYRTTQPSLSFIYVYRFTTRRSQYVVPHLKFKSREIVRSWNPIKSLSVIRNTFCTQTLRNLVSQVSCAQKRLLHSSSRRKISNRFGNTN